MTALIVTKSVRNVFAPQTVTKLCALFLGSVMTFAGTVACSQEAQEPETVHASSTAAPDRNLMTIWSQTNGCACTIGTTIVSYQVCGWLPKESTTQAKFKCYPPVSLEGPVPGGYFDAAAYQPVLGSRSQTNSETIETAVYELDMPDAGFPILLAYTKKDVITSTGVASSVTGTKSLSITQLGSVVSNSGTTGTVMPVVGTSNLIVGTDASSTVCLVNPTKMTVVATLEAPSTSAVLGNASVDVFGHIALTWSDGSTTFFSSKGVALPFDQSPGGALAISSPIKVASPLKIGGGAQR
jgi:hypothetical protein